MHTNQTVNYALSQFIGTDIPNPLTDYNGDMAKIDTAIKNVADASVGDRDEIAALKVQNGSETLETTAQTLSGAVNELNSGYGDVNTRLTTAEGKITADEGTLATVVGNVSTLAGKVGAVETKVGTAVLTTTAPDLSGAVNELDADIATEDGKIVALQNQNGSEVLQTTAQTLSGAINELHNATPSGVDADDVSYDNTTSGLTATNVQSAIDELAQGGSISVDADDVTYNNASSGLTATNVQDAIDEVASNNHKLPYIDTGHRRAVMAQDLSVTSYTMTEDAWVSASCYVAGTTLNLQADGNDVYLRTISGEGNSGYFFDMVGLFKAGTVLTVPTHTASTWAIRVDPLS